MVMQYAKPAGTSVSIRFDPFLLLLGVSVRGRRGFDPADYFQCRFDAAAAKTRDVLFGKNPSELAE